MTEIRIDDDLPHPPQRVWRALTDPQVLREWFMVTEIGAERAEGFTLRPHDEAGFDSPVTGEIVEVQRPERLVMRWSATDLHTLVTVTVRAIDEGCRLSMVQRGFLGTQGTLRRRVLQRTYGEMLEGLRAALDRLAEQERERLSTRRRGEGTNLGAAGGRRRNDARFGVLPPKGAVGAARAGWWPQLRGSRSPSATGLPPWRWRSRVARGVAPSPGEPLIESPTAPLYRATWRRHRPASPGGPMASLRRRVRDGWAGVTTFSTDRGKIAIIGSVAVLVLSAGVAVLVERWTEPAPRSPRSPAVGGARASTDPGGLGTPSEDGGEAEASPGSSPRSSEVVTLSAEYGMDRTMVGGYQASLTINNLTSNPVDGWRVTIVLPPLGLAVHDVRGAKSASHGDKNILFTPLASTRVVPAGSSVRFTFQVQGVGYPAACTIDGRPCTGIRDAVHGNAG